MKLKNACQSSMNLFTKNDQNCVVPENIYTPQRRATEIPRRGGSQKDAISEGVGGSFLKSFSRDFE